MTPDPRPLRVFFSVAEDSADVHMAALVRRARALLPQARFYGLTGPRTRALGCETVAELASHAAMLSGVFGLFGKALRRVRQVVEAWRGERPDVVLLLDSPELHLGVYELGLRGLAGRARELGIPVLYYIAPQTWASRAWREKWIRRDVSRLARILPFEEPYFRERGLAAEFVGHPLFETLRSERPSAEIAGRLRAGGRPVIALLPGSRRQVIEAMLPRQLEVVRRLRAAGRAVTAAVSCVDETRLATIRRFIGRFDDVEIVVADNASLLSAAELVLVASGTATLEVAHYRKPMIVMYDAGALGRLHERAGWLLIKTPHLSLVNLLAGARVVPEFMPSIADVAPIARVAAQLLADRAWRGLMAAQMAETLRPLESGSASTRVCELLAELAR